MALEQDALEYHRMGRKGKIEITPTKPCDTDRDLSLAYSPGVAAPCIEIQKNPAEVFEYTARGNLVGVISNGTAVLGLGNIGALASKPVMEGKGVLFKKFADIDVFDIEITATDPKEFIQTVQNLEPTFGGINLEDIKAPECFEIEETLRKTMKIPVFHDDQHGTAIISAAALINAVEVANKKLHEVRIVVNGAGASAVACTNQFIALGAKRENIMMCDSKGVVHKARAEGMNRYKAQFAVETDRRTLTDALQGADVFVGLSVGGAVTKEMIKGMADRPIIFAMANPTPEILPEEAKSVRPDVIMATGRSDYPNQVNNVLGFPFIFRGALDVRATCINEEMKLAATKALAALAKEEVPESVSRAYGGKTFRFGAEYLIPKPFDPRVLLHIAPAVAKAAMESGVAQNPIEDFDAYRDKLEGMFGAARVFIRSAMNRVKSTIAKDSKQKPRIVFPEAHSEKVLKAIQIIIEEGIAEPVLLGYENVVRPLIEKLELDQLVRLPILRPSQDERYQEYAETLFHLRARKGVHMQEAHRLMADPNYFAAMAVHLGHADAMINGATQNYRDSVTPILEIIGRPRRGLAAGLIIMILKEKVVFFADTTLNIDPTAEEVAAIAVQCAEVASFFHIEPRIAMLSFSNFTGKHESPAKMKHAAQIVKARFPNLVVDGEMQADTAVNGDFMREFFPFCELKSDANILVFPNLDSGNIAYKLIQQIGGGEALGPFLMGVKKPAHVLQRACTVNDIVNTVALASLHVQAIREMKAHR
ncbi:MAG: NADP-dependent malic enzyme [Bdellovibrionales bacterium CG10_big_fil_rev_8_21_14_0_10_45_34]|nr:MAG: NADP-dependent malic enzyme [Bdellovibrionales bacterium CG10_big_fil_rev_8_21_14_0_10_45_34]